MASFHVSANELKDLMNCRGGDGIKHLMENYGDVHGLARKLRVVPEDGLDGKHSDVKLRKQVFGVNKIASAKSKSIWTLVWEALKDPTLIMLQSVALVSFALSFYNPPAEELDQDTDIQDDDSKSGMIESLAIFFCVILVVLVTAVNDYNKEQQFLGLQNRLEQEQKINVLRNRIIVEICITDLVVGDICIIKYGDVIPADGVLIQSNELKVDESSFTGESDLVHKSTDKDVLVFYSTHVMDGNGMFLITAVGVNTQAGAIQLLMRNTDGTLLKAKSVLQAKLAKLAVKIGYFGLTCGFITIILLIGHFSISKFIIEKKPFHITDVKYFVKFIIIGITIMVVSVPEGLPLAVTLSLAYSVQQMMKDNNLVRHLDACETMGNATCVCVDKTGTLTNNRMTAVQCYVCNVLYKDLDSGRSIKLPTKVERLLAENIALNSSFTSRLAKDENGLIKQYGNKTECALLAFLSNIRYDYRDVREKFDPKQLHRVFSFNSTRKTMRTVIKLPNGKGFRLIAKGASEIILAKCAFLIGYNGEILRLPQTEKDKITNEVIRKMAFDGLRTIALAYIDYLFDPAESIPVNCKAITANTEPNWDSEESFSEMTYLAAVGIEDPLRSDVPQAIKKCQSAGITVRMITGDNLDTAKSIAIKCGIISKWEVDNRGVILESSEFNRKIRDVKGVVDQKLFDNVWPKLRVLARSTPVDKYILVKHIIESRTSEAQEVVAVTGDGTNDAPALKVADVGFAMGIQGTEVAKEASDIIITDDNFSSIIKAVVWGRNVYDSICKFIQFQLTVNVVAVLVAFSSETPLKAVQMLWVNLIMDTLGSLALSTEKPTNELLLRKPYGRNRAIISGDMLKMITGSVLYQMTVLMGFLFYGDILLDIDSGITMPLGAPPNVHFTMIFNILVLMTLFNEINARKINGDRNIFQGFFSNWIFCSILFITSTMQVLIVQYGGLVFWVVPLTLCQWLWCLLFGFSMLLWGQFLITIVYRDGPDIDLVAFYESQSRPADELSTRHQSLSI